MRLGLEGNGVRVASASGILPGVQCRNCIALRLVTAYAPMDRQSMQGILRLERLKCENEVGYREI